MDNRTNYVKGMWREISFALHATILAVIVNTIGDGNTLLLSSRNYVVALNTTEFYSGSIVTEWMIDPETSLR